ncbi:MAG: MFS transporter [Breoghania sp.]|nr:MFS transporter [Breoghania sp.]
MGVGLWIAKNWLIGVPSEPSKTDADKESDKSAATSREEKERQAALSPARRLAAWLLAVAFACQTFMFYGLTAWLPVFLTGTAGVSTTNAGIAESLFQMLDFLGCFGVPWLSSKLHLSNRSLFVVVAGS